jgi:hypothetical protein
VNPKVMTTNLNKNFYSQRKRDKEKYQFGLTSTYILMLSFISILLLYYVWMLNANATKWESIRQLDIQVQQLKLERELLDVRIADLESLDAVWEEGYDMEKIENPDYLVIKDDVNYVYNY